MNIRVLFFIQNVAGINTGRGGHYHSLHTTANALLPHIDLGVVVLGNQEQVVLRGVEYPVWHIDMGPGTIRSAIKDARKVVRRFAPDVIHAFDINSFWFTRAVSLGSSLGILQTRCGGPKRRYSPFADNLVVYTQEDLDFFRSNRRFSRSDVHLIPNRTTEIQQDPERIARLRTMLDTDAAIFLRIGRISNSYRGSLLQTAALVQDLNRDGISCHLLCIGAPQSREVVAEVEESVGQFGTIVTDPVFTRNANQLIDIGDFVVGTGRSLMEASTRKRVVLTPIQGGPHPALVTAENFDSFFATNFSPRNTYAGHNVQLNYEKIARLAQDPKARECAEAYSGSLFNKHFDVAAAVPKYLDLYNRVKHRGQTAYKRPSAVADFIVHLARVVTTLQIGRWRARGQSDHGRSAHGPSGTQVV